MSKNTKSNSKNLRERLSSRGGRFTSITVKRAKSGVSSYCAQILSVSDKSLRFYDVNAKRNVVVPLANVVG